MCALLANCQLIQVDVDALMHFLGAVHVLCGKASLNNTVMIDSAHQLPSNRMSVIMLRTNVPSHHLLIQDRSAGLR